MKDNHEIDRVYELARRGLRDDATPNEKQVLEILRCLTNNIVGLDQLAVRGIAELAKLLSRYGDELSDAVQTYIDPERCDQLLIKREQDESEVRYLLAEKPLSDGDKLDMMTEYSWEPVVFKWDGNADKTPVIQKGKEEAYIDKDETAAFRWYRG